MKKFKRFICLAVIVLISAFFVGDRLIGWDEACGEPCEKVVEKGCDMVCRGGGNTCTGCYWHGDCEHGICIIYADYFCSNGQHYDNIVFCSQAPCPK